MRGAALAVRHVAGPGFAPSTVANIVWFPDGIQRRAAARARGGDTGRQRPPGQPGGRVVLWPRRFWPRRPQDIDSAIIQVWRLHSCGIIDAIEVEIRESEYRAMRGWIR
jgi:hypothetical protein